MLGVERVGVEDNFFSLGGESILSIQVVSRARQAGLRLTSKDIFQHQTVTLLAANVSVVVAEPVDQGLVCGAVPLTPIQRWFFESTSHRPERFSQSVWVELVEGVDETALREALAGLVVHHDGVADAV